VAVPATSTWVDPRPASPAPAAAPASPAVGADPITVKNIQYALGRLGYDAGTADGSLGPRTRAAIERYQRDNGLAADGQPSARLWEHLRGRI
jgi:membrane-bound lytic murein transglycosylase B